MRGKGLLIIGIILIIISGVGFFYRKNKINEIDKNRTNIFDITNSGSKSENINVYLNASYIDGPIATFENNDEYSFFVFFDEGVQHLGYIKNTLAKEIRTYLLDNPDETYKINGITKIIPKDMEDYGKKFVKEWLDNNHDHSGVNDDHSHEITTEDFYTYFGYVYLDTTVSSSSYYKMFTIIISLIGLFGITILGYSVYEKIVQKDKI